MTEEDARDQVRALVGGDAVDRLDRFAAMVIAENARQNLVAGSTLGSLWARHLLDSVQLLRWAPETGVWLDIGTGGGFPGLVIAIVTDRPMTLVEPRRKRADFLKAASEAMTLRNVTVAQQRVETLAGVAAAVISARAVAPIAPLVQASRSCAARETRWILPRGASYAEDVTAARSSLNAMFHVEQSLTDPAAGIVIVRGVATR